MAGSPMRHERRRVVNAAFELAFRDKGMTPEEALKPMVMAQIAKAEKGNTDAFCAIRDTLDGRPVQPTREEAETPKLVSLALLGAAAELLDRIPAKRVEVDVTPKGERLAQAIRSDQG